MKTLTVKIPEELEAKLDRLVAQRGGSRSSLIRAALKELTTSADPPSSAIFTVDTDFGLYRKHGRQVIPTIMPG